MHTIQADAPPPRSTLVVGGRTGSPPNILLMLFGDYWFRGTGHLPSAALVTLLGDFGVNDAAARAALSRMVKRGLLAATKSGRTTAYCVTERGQHVLDGASRRIAEFGVGERPWPAVWSVVAFATPQNSRSLRAAIRTRLEWLGFAPLYESLWICPHDRHEDAVRTLQELGVEATPLQATLAESALPTRVPQRAWNLDDLREQYDDFVAQCESALARADDAAVTDAEILVERTRLLETWLHLSGLDPDLPTAILPEGWPRDRARHLFLLAHERLGLRATARVRAVVHEHDASAAMAVEQRTANDWAELAR